MGEVFFTLLCFALIIILQGFFINSVYEMFRGKPRNDINKGLVYEGNILYMLFPKFIKKNRDKHWAKPFFGCVKCMASIYGSLTYWAIVGKSMGFNYYTVLFWLLDIVILVTVNFIIYKKV